jgi:hypothetical protein
MNAYELADRLDLEPYGIYGEQAANMLRQQATLIDYYKVRDSSYQKTIAELKQVLQSIANEPIELSHDKIKWQCQDHIRWAKEVLK